MARMTKAEKIARIPIEEISKISNKDRKKLEGYVKTLRSGYKRRVASFDRKGLFSYAEEAFKKTSTGKHPSVQLTKLTRNQLIFEFVRYSKFFQDETSSEAGIKRVNREQDIRIFGEGKRGLPKYSMTNEQRERYWSLYDEFKVQKRDSFYKIGSERLQTMLGEFGGLNQEITDENIVEFLDKVEERVKKEYISLNLEGVPNVYSGKGPSFKKGSNM